MNKREISWIIFLTFIGIILVYLIGAFIIMQPNPASWSMFARVVAVIGVIISWVASVNIVDEYIY